MVESANEELRSKALDESNRSVQYLTNELEKTTALDLRQTINTLISTNLKQSVLASVRKDYAFRVISPAVVPTDRDYIWPRRGVMAASGFVLGGLTGLILALGLARTRRSAPT